MNLLKIIAVSIFSSQIILAQTSKINLFSASQVNLKKHVEVLGSDLFEGRGTGTKGGELAANYIAGVYKNIGLLPAGRENSYFQEVPLHGASYLKESELIIYFNDDSLSLRIGTDYLLLNSGEQTIIPSKTEIIFLGYGIIAPEFDYNDYLEKDVSGKVLLLVNGEPYSNDPEFFNGDEPTVHSYPDVKHRVAISRGAAGTILIPAINEHSDESWQKMKLEYSFEDVKLSYNASNRFGIIINPAIANDLFCIEDRKEMNDLAEEDFLLKNYKIKFEGEFFVRDFKSSNVVGFLESNKNIDECVIVSAHYDHLGIGPEINGDKIYNGVLDNAMGVSAMLEIARILKNEEQNLSRSVLFIATTGEEKGLLGSTYYIDHPLFPLYKTAANVNIDGISFIDKFRSVIGIGADLSSLNNLLEESAADFKLSLSKLPKEFYKSESFNRSDQISFAKAGIPSILILDAPYYENIDNKTAVNKIINFNENIYHTPFDDLNIEINYYAAQLHTDLLANFINRIAVTREKIFWNNNVPYNYIRLQTIAEKR